MSLLLIWRRYGAARDFTRRRVATGWCSHLVLWLTQNLSAFPELATPFVAALLSLPAGARENLLRLDTSAEKAPVVRGAALEYSLAPLPSQWDGALVGEALASIVVSQGLEHLDVEHFQVLSTALHSADLSDSKWLSTFEALKDFIYVAVCDGDISTMALQILRTFAVESSLGPAVFSVRALRGTCTRDKTLSLTCASLAWLYSTGPDACGGDATHALAGPRQPRCPPERASSAAVVWVLSE